MDSLRRILFPVDFSEHALAVAPTIAAFARQFGARVTLLHVLPHGALEEHKTRAQEELGAFAWPHFSGTPSCQVLAEGDAAENIVRQAANEHIDLIMMPTHGYGPFRRFLLGSVALKVLHDARCPVWTDVHRESPQAHAVLEDSHSHPVELAGDSVPGILYEHIACAVDLTPHSRPPLRWAAQCAADFHAKLTIVHAIPLTVPLAGPDAPLLDWTPQVQAAARQKIAELQESEGTNADATVVTGEVAYAVYDAVKALGADLLVIGRSVEDDRIGRLRTHAYSIIRHSPCPVISV